MNGKDGDVTDSSQHADGTRAARPTGFSRTKRLMVTLPIFIILLGILVTVSTNTRIEVEDTPRAMSFATLTPDTAVTFDTEDELPGAGTYKVRKQYRTIDAKRPSTGEVQRVRVLIRTPEGAPSKGLPGMVFMHGAGYGTCDNSFGDIATSMASAGFVTAVLDKPVWSTSDLNRDYRGSAVVYDQVIDMLRSMDAVDGHKVGIYATSEATWISSYLLDIDDDVAFQILLSPMVFSPRHSLAFLAVQNFALAGANGGYQSIVRRVFSFDLAMFHLDNIDIRTSTPKAFSIPTMVAYGSKDVMTAQVQGFKEILALAHRAGNWDVSLRSYPIANHVLRLGDESMSGTPFADDYVDDMVAWAVGTSRGLKQTSERIAGTPLYQSIPVPRGLHAHRVMTVYGTIVLALMAVMMLVSLVVALVALVMHIRNRRRGLGPALGLRERFGGALLMLTIVTLVALFVFLGGFGEVVIAVVHMAWGSAPPDDSGMMYWSWPFIQVVCIVLLWAWSRVFAGIIEALSMRGVLQWPMRRGALRQIASGAQPVVATTRLGRVLFWTVAFTMLLILLSFSFWGLFLF